MRKLRYELVVLSVVCAAASVESVTVSSDANIDDESDAVGGSPSICLSRRHSRHLLGGLAVRHDVSRCSEIALMVLGRRQ